MKTLILLLIPGVVMAYGSGGGHASGGHSSAHSSAHVSGAHPSVSEPHVSSFRSSASRSLVNVPIFAHGGSHPSYTTAIHEPSYWYFLSKCRQEHSYEDCK